MDFCWIQKFVIHLFQQQKHHPNERKTDSIDADAELFTDAVCKCYRSTKGNTSTYTEWKK